MTSTKSNSKSKSAPKDSSSEKNVCDICGREKKHPLAQHCDGCWESLKGLGDVVNHRKGYDEVKRILLKSKFTMRLIHEAVMKNAEEERKKYKGNDSEFVDKFLMPHIKFLHKAFLDICNIKDDYDIHIKAFIAKTAGPVHNYSRATEKEKLDFFYTLGGNVTELSDLLKKYKVN